MAESSALIVDFLYERKVEFMNFNNSHKLFEDNADIIKLNSISEPVALFSAIDKEIQINKTESLPVESSEVVLIFPLYTPKKNYGYLLLGQKKSGGKFNQEDIDLINSIVNASSEIIENIELQKEIALEQVEKLKLSELNKLKSLYVSCVSHDLKTPLTSIKMFSQLLQNDSKIGNKTKNEYLRIIEEESNRLTRLVDNVLSYSKIERGIKNYSFNIVDLNIIAKDTIQLMEYTFKMERFEVVTEFSEDQLFITADSDSIKEILINLLNNSVKYSDNSRFISIRTFKENDSAIVEVMDKGIGIADENKKHLFEEFYSLKDENKKYKGGVGLGLSIVKRIVDAHKGEIIIESNLGKGTLVKIYLPLNKHE